MPAGIPSFASQPHTTYKVRNKILAGGKTIHFGNNVSKFFNRTRRVWRPNIQHKNLWSEALGRRTKLRLVTSVLRTIDKVGGLDAYLTCSTRRRMKELGPRGWEIRAAVIKGLRETERPKYVRLLQRSILLCPGLRMDSQWKEIRPLIKHTEGYAVLPEEYCKRAFKVLMERLRVGRPVVRRKTLGSNVIVLNRHFAKQFARIKEGNKKIPTTWSMRPKRRTDEILTTPFFEPQGTALTDETKAPEQKKFKLSRNQMKKMRTQRRAERLAKMTERQIKVKRRSKAQLS
jgi:ribosomal protein L28